MCEQLKYKKIKSGYSTKKLGSLWSFPKYFVFTLFLTGTALFLGGCAAIPLSAEHAGSIHKIGVVSLLGNSIHGSFTGTTIFGNRIFDENASEIRMDETAESIVIKEIRAGGRYSAVALPQERAEALAKSQAANGWRTRLYGAHSNDLNEQAVLIARAHQVDAVIFIIPVSESEAPVPRNGWGIAGTNHFGLTSFMAYVNSQVKLMDGHTGKVLAETLNKEVAAAAAPKGFPWKDGYSQYSASEKELIRNQLHTILETTLPKELQAMNLR